MVESVIVYKGWQFIFMIMVGILWSFMGERGNINIFVVEGSVWSLLVKDIRLC